MRPWIVAKFGDNLQISKLGLTQEQIASLTPNFEFTIEQTEEQEVNGNIVVIMLLSIVLFYAIYFCVGLIQICLIVGVALVSAKAFLDPELLNSVLDMSMMTPYLAVITIVYFILGYFAYALLYALTGSTVSKPEDIQSANTPVAILAIVGFYLSYFTMMNPTSELNQFAAIFPISSPFCMPFRIMMGIASTSEIILSIVILVITILIIAQVAIKIYSNAILNYGTRMTFRDIVKVYRDKNN